MICDISEVGAKGFDRVNECMGKLREVMNTMAIVLTL